MYPGQAIADRFEIELEVAEGGMGTVYRALDRATGEKAAIKLLHERWIGHAERFVREAAVLADLAHPRIVRYLAHGCTPRGVPWLAMEWLEGETLHSRLDRAPLSVGEAVAMGRGVAEALALAHRRGLVHRDLKPTNIFLPGGRAEDVKVLDFGLVKQRLPGMKPLTFTGTVMGTIEYMAPEQARGRRVDPRADVFALGCCLHEALTGEPPFQAEDFLAVRAKILLEDPRPIRRVRPDVPPAFEWLLDRMLAKEPADRPADGGALVVRFAALDRQTPGGTSEPPPTSGISDAERHWISVVMASGSGQALDLEATVPSDAASDELDARAELMAIVQSHSGRMELLPDGAVIVSIAGAGAPTDQATTAGRCAMAMQRCLPGQPLVVATGPGTLAHGAAVGEVIDRAAALLRRSGPGLIRIDEATAGLLRGRLGVITDPGGLQLAGVFVSADTPRTLLGRTMPFLGRERELAVLEATLGACIEEEMARALVVVGPPGSGKTRLIQEFLARAAIRRGIRLLVGTGDPVAAGTPRGLLARALRGAAGIEDEDSLEARREALRARVDEHVPAAERERVATFLGELAGVWFSPEGNEALRAAQADPTLMADAMRRAWEDFLDAEARSGPLVLLLEDLHWGDLPTVKFVDAALARLRDRPFLVIAVGRPELQAQFPGLWAERTSQTLQLRELSSRACEALVKVALADAGQETIARVVQSSEGNAFALEELCRAVAAGRGEHFPETVLAMVESRLATLAGDAKRALRAGSIFGQTFRESGVARVLGAPPRLDELVEREVIVPLRSGPGESVYAFRHPILREAAYALLTDDDKALGHRLAAGWLADHGETDPTVLAEHHRLGRSFEDAVPWYQLSAEDALESGDLEAAIRQAGRGLECGAAGAARGHLLRIQAEAWFKSGKMTEVVPLAEEGAALLEAGTPAWYQIVGDLVGASLGDAERLRIWGERARRVMPEPGAVSARFVCLCRLATIEMARGRGPAARDIISELGQAAALITELELTAAIRFPATAGVLAVFEGDLGSAIKSFNRAVAAARRVGHDRELGLLLSNLIFTHLELGDEEQAENRLQEVSDLSRASLPGQVVATLRLYRARLDSLHDRLPAAIEAAVAVVSESAGNRWVEGSARTYLASFLTQAGDLPAAEREARAALELLQAAPPARGFTLAILSSVLLQAGRTPEALASAEEAMRILESVGVREGEQRVRLAHVQALEAAGRAADALAALRIARDRIHVRAGRLAEPALRAAFLERAPGCAATLALAEARLGR